MLKYYIYKGKQFQFEESKAPEGAVELKAEKAKSEKPEELEEPKAYIPKHKAVEPKNKAKKSPAKKKAVTE